MTVSTFPPGDDAAASRLLAYLRKQDYRYTTITPLTHQHVLDRRRRHVCRNAARLVWLEPAVRQTGFPGGID